MTLEDPVWTQPAGWPGVGPMIVMGPYEPVTLGNDDGQNDVVDALGVFFRENGGVGVTIGPSGPCFPHQITSGWAITLAGAHLHISANGCLVYDGRTRPDEDWRANVWAAVQAGEGILVVGTTIPLGQNNGHTIGDVIKQGPGGRGPRGADLGSQTGELAS